MNRHVLMSTRPVAALIALVAVVASTLALAAPAQAEPDSRPRVLLLGYDNEPYVADVVDKLEASGSFAEVSVMPGSNSCTFGTPALAELEEYDAVFLWTDCSIPDPSGLGNVLADYVDGGGRLVLGVFATSAGYAPSGRLISDGYLPVALQNHSSQTPETLVADLPGHPLLDGVTSFHGGSSSYHGTGLQLTEGSTLVAHWSDGEPLVATRGNVVVLNFFPPSSTIRPDFWDASTDGVPLMVNALTRGLEMAPSFTSAASATLTAGTAEAFTVKTVGHPRAAITTTSALPTGLTLTDNGNGTATIAGTPAAGTGGVHSIALTATNGVEPDATQTLDLTVNEAPVVTTLPTAAFAVGSAGSFSVAATPGHPAATTLTATGDLPAGMTFTDNGDGTATVSGTPADGSAGTYPVTVKADNGALSTTQTLTVSVSLVAQTVTITSTPPASTPVVGQTYAVTATGGASPNPVVVSIDPASASVCAVDGSTVTFDHPGSCVINADQAGNGRYAAASTSQTVAVTAAATTTELTVKSDRLAAKVTASAPGAGTPTGTVTFSVDGVEVGSAPLVDGTATLAHRLESGRSRAVAAVYSGDGDYTASSGSTARRDPVITARVTSAKARSAAGWYRTPVTVTFRCASGGSGLTAACPKPVTLKANRAGQSVTRTILAADGGAATVTVGAINIDRRAPKVAIKGVRKGATYPGQAPKARCVSKDKLSGIARCKVSKRVRGESVTIRATATDRAGNKRISTVRYRVARFYVSGATFRQGSYRVSEGKTYLVVALTSGSSRPQYYNASLRDSTPTASGSYLRRSGKQSGLHRHVLPVRMDRGMSRHGRWDLGVKVGRTLHRIPVTVRR